jgi:hypothetical protein
MGYPHDFMTGERVREFAFGGWLEKLDNPSDPKRGR